MNTTISEVLEFVKDNDVKFIRFSFCNMLGQKKNMAIMAGELETAFSEGVSFDGSAVSGFSDVTRSDLLLFPDPSTLTVLPWRPGLGRVAQLFCDVRQPNLKPCITDSRLILKKVLNRAAEQGYTCKIGAECEFYIIKTDENGEATTPPQTFDKGGYLDVSPLDKCENIRREICLTLEEMGIQPESSHHERGPGQNEVDFKFSDALSCADNFLTFKTVVKEIAARNGLFATFLPKPVPDSAGSGLHVNLSLYKNGINLFRDITSLTADSADTATAHFLAGILEKAPEITAFLNPLANSYERLGKFEAPNFVSWSHQNRSQLIRIPAANGERGRIELRSPDPTINPYIAFALIIAAGLDGIENNTPLQPPIDVDLSAVDKSLTQKLTALPKTLDNAINLAKNSKFVKSIIGEEFLSKYISLKSKEVSDTGIKSIFNIII